MADTIITVTGTNFYFGTEGLYRGLKLKLVKEPDNRYDREAIKVEAPGLGRIGYVANSVKTVQGESISAGRLYDHMGKTASAKVLYVFPNMLICRVSKKSLITQPVPLPPPPRGDDDDLPHGMRDDEDISF